MMVEDRVIATAIVFQRAILLVHEGGKYAIKRYGQGLEGGIGFWEDTLDEAWTRFIGVQQSALKRQPSCLTPEEQRWVKGLEDFSHWKKTAEPSAASLSQREVTLGGSMGPALSLCVEFVST